jgi:hypothetical protein
MKARGYLVLGEKPGEELPLLPLPLLLQPHRHPHHRRHLAHLHQHPLYMGVLASLYSVVVRLLSSFNHAPLVPWVPFPLPLASPLFLARFLPYNSSLFFFVPLSM